MLIKLMSIKVNNHKLVSKIWDIVLLHTVHWNKHKIVILISDLLIKLVYLIIKKWNNSKSIRNIVNVFFVILIVNIEKLNKLQVKNKNQLIKNKRIKHLINYHFFKN